MTPKNIAKSNGQLIKLAKGSGELIWYKHDNEDDLFIVFKGCLTIKLRDRDIELGVEIFVVEKGVEHCPVAKQHTYFMMIEPESTVHTGNIQSDWTVASKNQQWI